MNKFSTRFNHNDFMYDAWISFQENYAEEENLDFNFDNVKARTILAKSVIDWLNEDLKTQLTFESMYFPKEYNFESDAINLTFSDSDFDKVYTVFANNENLMKLLKESVKNYTTPTSGYLPFHTEGKVYKDKGLLMGVMLEVYNNQFIDDYESYYDVQCVYDTMYNESVE